MEKYLDRGKPGLKGRAFLAAALLAVLLFAPAVGRAHDVNCQRIPNGRGEMICPPPLGGIMTDINGSVVCGPGFCARDSYGRVKCSSVVGGAVDLDSNGNVLCVGGCLDGATSYCVSPRP